MHWSYSALCVNGWRDSGVTRGWAAVDVPGGMPHEQHGHKRAFSAADVGVYEGCPIDAQLRSSLSSRFLFRRAVFRNTHSDRSADGAPVRVARSPPETLDRMGCSSARAVERLIVLGLCHAAFEQACRYHHAHLHSRVRRDGCECVTTSQKRQTSTGTVGASTRWENPITVQTQAVQVCECRDHDDAAAP